MRSCVLIATVAVGNLYVDTGILVKLLCPEPDTVYFDRELQGHPLITSELALVEVRSAFYAKERTRLLSKAQRLRAEAKFAEMIGSKEIELRPLNTPILSKAAQILQTCYAKVSLRTLDAIHIATCDLSQEFPLCTTDARMHAAARMLQIPVFPLELPKKT